MFNDGHFGIVLGFFSILYNSLLVEIFYRDFVICEVILERFWQGRSCESLLGEV